MLNFSLLTEHSPQNNFTDDESDIETDRVKRFKRGKKIIKDSEEEDEDISSSTDKQDVTNPSRGSNSVRTKKSLSTSPEDKEVNERKRRSRSRSRSKDCSISSRTSISDTTNSEGGSDVKGKASRNSDSASDSE